MNLGTSLYSYKQGFSQLDKNEVDLVMCLNSPTLPSLERFCEFFSCMQLEYCLRESLSKFEGLSTFYCNFINVVLHIWDIRPIPTIRTTYV